MHPTKFIMILLFAAGLLFSGCKGCQPSTDKSAEPVSIAALKSMKAGDKALEKEYEVKAFFTHDPVPMLVTDMKYTMINTPMPDSVFISISGPAADSMRANPDMYYGTEVILRGKLNISRQKANPKGFDFDFTCGTPPIVIRPHRTGLLIPKFYDICKIYPPICKPGGITYTGRTAILYSGGYNSSNAHFRYWNDLKFMYKTLISKYGYTDADIIVVYKNGVAEDADMTVDYAASTTGLASAINDAKAKLGIAVVRKLFVFTTNHGGGYHTTDGVQGGLADASPGDEPETTNRFDETIFYYNMSPNTITDDAFVTMINSIGATDVITVHEPCFSGGFLYDLRGPKHVNVSAATEFEYSWSGAPGDHDMFSYYFTAALNSADAFGAPVNADTNSDGKISILEAFLYAKSKDTAAESPQLEDSGDGISTNSPSSTVGDGVLANKTFL